MPGPPYNGGSRLRDICASDLNNAVENDRQLREGKYDSPIPEYTARVIPEGCIEMKNHTGEDLGAGAIVGLGAPLIDESSGTSIGNWLENPILYAEEYDEDTHGCRFGIVQEPARDGCIIIVCICGTTTAYANIEDEEHEFISPENGSTVMKSSKCGCMRIQSDVQGTGNQRVIACFDPCGCPDGPPGSTVMGTVQGTVSPGEEGTVLIEGEERPFLYDCDMEDADDLEDGEEIELFITCDCELIFCGCVGDGGPSVDLIGTCCCPDLETRFCCYRDGSPDPNISTEAACNFVSGLWAPCLPGTGPGDPSSSRCVISTEEMCEKVGGDWFPPGDDGCTEGTRCIVFQCFKRAVGCEIDPTVNEGEELVDCPCNEIELCRVCNPIHGESGSQSVSANGSGSGQNTGSQVDDECFCATAFLSGSSNLGFSATWDGVPGFVTPPAINSQFRIYPSTPLPFGAPLVSAVISNNGIRFVANSPVTGLPAPSCDHTEDLSFSGAANAPLIGYNLTGTGTVSISSAWTGNCTLLMTINFSASVTGTVTDIDEAVWPATAMMNETCEVSLNVACRTCTTSEIATGSDSGNPNFNYESSASTNFSGSGQGILKLGSANALASAAQPGTELQGIFKELGIQAVLLEKLGMKTCPNCDATAAKMNRIGVEGCKEQAADIIKEIESNAKNLGHKGGIIARFGIGKLFWIAIRRAEGTSGLVDNSTLTAIKLLMRKNDVSES